MKKEFKIFKYMTPITENEVFSATAQRLFQHQLI
jgi:hypothetical protein